MPKREPFYQVGICPTCSEQTRQRFVFGVNECRGEMTDSGRRYVYGDVHTLSLFRCDGCNAIVLYKTYYADAVEIEEAEKLDPKWIFQLDDLDSESYFKDHSSLLYSTHQQAGERALSDHAPDEIKTIYGDALKVKRIVPNSFAVQIRKALEAICIDRGESGRNLDADLTRLSKAGVFPPIVAKIAHELRESGNVGAHVKPREVEPEQVQAIDDFSI